MDLRILTVIGLCCGLFPPFGLCPVAGAETGAEAEPQTGYVEPDFTTRLFNPDALSLEGEARDAVVSALALLAGPVPGAEEIGSLVRMKSLAVALRLDSMNATAREANDALIAGEAPGLVESGFANADEVAEFLWEEAHRLRNDKIEEEDARLYPFLMDIAAAVDPSVQEGGADEDLVSIGREADLWGEVLPVSEGSGGKEPGTAVTEGVKSEPEPEASKTVVASVSEPGTPPPSMPENSPAQQPAGQMEPRGGKGRGRPELPAAEFKRQEAVLRVVVFEETGERGAERAVPCRLTASVSGEAPEDHRRPFHCEAGIDPVVARQLDATVRLLQRRHFARLADSGRINFELTSLEDGRQLALEEPRIGITVLILLDALLTGIELDDGVSMGGVLPSEVGRVSKPRGRWAEIVEAAARGGAEAVIVSRSAKADLTDMLVSGELDPLLRVQMIEFGDAGEAAAFVSKRRDADVEKALQLFGEIQSLRSRLEPKELAVNGKVRERFREILALMPGHLSAELLLNYGDGEMPERMSLRGSVRRIDSHLVPMKELGAVANTVVVGSADDDLCADSIFALRRIRPRLAEASLAYCDAAVDLAERIREYLKLSNLTTKKATDQAAGIESARTRVETLRRELGRVVGEL